MSYITYTCSICVCWILMLQCCRWLGWTRELCWIKHKRWSFTMQVGNLLPHPAGHPVTEVQTTLVGNQAAMSYTISWVIYNLISSGTLAQDKGRSQTESRWSQSSQQWKRVLGHSSFETHQSMGWGCYSARPWKPARGWQCSPRPVNWRMDSLSV